MRAVRIRKEEVRENCMTMLPKMDLGKTVSF